MFRHQLIPESNQDHTNSSSQDALFPDDDPNASISSTTFPPSNTIPDPSATTEVISVNDHDTTIDAWSMETTIIDDFGGDHDITFEGASPGDIGLVNDDFRDGDITLDVRHANVVLQDLPEAIDSLSWNASSLQDALSADIFSFA